MDRQIVSTPGIITFFFLALVSACTGTGNEATKPIEIERRDKYLVLDTTLFSEITNLKLTQGQTRKYSGNPLFNEEKDWEVRFDNVYPNVLYDEEEHIYKCWYNPFIVDPATSGSSEQKKQQVSYSEARQEYGREREAAVCYAYSIDGLNWVKPDLSVHPWNGLPSNIVMRQTHGAGVFKDLSSTDPKERYKMFFRNHSGGEEMVAVAYSADGIHWSEPEEFPNLDVQADTHNNTFWAPTLDSYVAITRDWDKENIGNIKQVRLAARSESRDFKHWVDSEVILRGEEDHLQIYSMPVFYYEGIYIGLPAIYNTLSDRTHTELAWSIDTRKWNRVEPGTPFIANGSNQGDYDWGCVYAAAAPIFLEDEIRIYYGASDGLHFDWRKGSLALASLRPDGFAGMGPLIPDSPGILKTHRLVPDGDVIQLAVDIEEGGYIQVSVLSDTERTVLEEIRTAGEHKAIGVPLKLIESGQLPIQLEFTLYKSKIYAFSFAQEPAKP